MAVRKIYHVVHHAADKMWHVTHNNQSLASHAAKEDAVARGRQIALANKPSQLVVHRKDGAIETEFTYDNDPYPPPG